MIFFCGGGCRIRTYGPRRTNSFQDCRFKPLSQSSIYVRKVGLEPTSPYRRQILSLLRLPISPHPRITEFLNTTFFRLNKIGAIIQVLYGEKVVFQDLHYLTVLSDLPSNKPHGTLPLYYSFQIYSYVIP